MIASPHFVSQPARRPDVLGELLHSLSQPLTSLQCSLELWLELSLEKSGGHQYESVALALQQTEEVIGMIRLMREYHEAERPAQGAFSTLLGPALRSVVEDLSSIAAVRGVGLHLTGTATATLPVAESRLRLALQYLIAPLIEAQPVGGEVVLSLREGARGAVLRVEGGCGCRALSGSTLTLRRVRLAIAGRVLESAGASLSLGDTDSAGFVLRIPRWVVASA
jgi:signal transduction histidine kinase